MIALGIIEFSVASGATITTLVNATNDFQTGQPSVTNMTFSAAGNYLGWACASDADTVTIAENIASIAATQGNNTTWIAGQHYSEIDEYELNLTSLNSPGNASFKNATSGWAMVAMMFLETPIAALTGSLLPINMSGGCNS